MTKIYVETNGYDMVAIIDNEENTVYYGTPSDIPNHPTETEAKDYLEQANACEWIGILFDTMDNEEWEDMMQDANNKILAEIED